MAHHGFEQHRAAVALDHRGLGERADRVGQLLGLGGELLVELALHFHDTRGTALANVLVGVGMGIARNISTGGLFVETRAPQPIGTQVRVTFPSDHGEMVAVAEDDHRRPETTLEGLAGLEYNAGCWVFRAVAQRLQARTNTTSTGIFLQIELTGVGQIGAGVTTAPMACFSSALKALARSIGGRGSLP